MKSVFNFDASRAKQWGVAALALMMAAPLVVNCGLVWGSAAGPVNGGWSTPSFELGNELAVSQGFKNDENRILAGDDGIYVISDYTHTINTWMGISDLMAEDEQYFMRATYTYYDDNGEEITGDNTSRNHSVLVSKADWRNYYRSSVYLDVKAKATAVKYDFYNATHNENGGTIAGKDLLKSFEAKFTYADYSSGAVPSYELVGVKQAGQEIVPEESFISGIMQFKVNSVEDYEYEIVGHNILEGDTYTINQEGENTAYSKSELEQGVTAKLRARYYGSVSSYGGYNTVFGSSYTNLKYQDGSFYISMDDNLNNGVQKYDVCVKYRNSDECIKTGWYTSGILPVSDDTVDIDDYDATNNPLVLYIKGADYDDAANYAVKVGIKYAGESIMSETFVATGAELKNGIAKDCFSELKYAKFSQMLDGTFKDGEIEVETEIGNTTRYMNFMFNGGATLNGVVFSSDGLTFNSYKYGHSDQSLSYAGVGKVAEYYTADYSDGLFGNHAYIQIGTSYGEADGATYHIYYQTDDTDLNDLRGATLVKEGTAGADGVLGLVRLDDKNGHYTVVLEKNDRIIDVAHFGFEFSNDEMTLGFMPVLKSEVEGALSNDMFNYGYSLYKMHEESPIRVTAYSAGVKDTDMYNLEISASSPYLSNSAGYSNSMVITGADLDGKTELAVLPYDEVFINGAYSGYIYMYLRDANGDLSASRSFYLSRSTEPSAATVSTEDTTLAIRELESKEEELVQNVTTGIADVQVDGDTMSVTAEKACTVIGRKDGKYVRVTINSTKEISSVDNESSNNTAHKYNIAGFDKIYVMLTGDVNMDGKVNSRDSALINYSLPSVTGSRHMDITDEMMLLMADVNKDGKINSRDSALINYSLPSVTGDRHKELAW